MKKIGALMVLVMILQGCTFYHGRKQDGADQTVDMDFGAGKKP